MAKRSNLPLLQLRQKQQIQTRLLPLPKDTAWMDELFAWANENKISQNQLSHNKQILWKQTKLDWSNCGLAEISSAIGNLSNLKMLDLRHNQLVELPESIGRLSNLMALLLCDNQLIELPESIGWLSNLGMLTLDGNQLIELPESFGNLRTLEILNLRNNKLTEIPKSFGKKVNLQALQLAGNQLTEIPEFITNLCELKSLDLSNNPLTKVPENILNMPNLVEIVGLEQFTQPKTKMKTYQQKILFGSPGTGKSYQIDNHIIPYELLIDVKKMPANVIKTVFHPEYTYGDFVGKLMPITVGGNVQYKFYEGHFLKALSQAYKNIIAAQNNDGDAENVALVIDEINRGNSAAIFGTIFQLLDRNPDGWSSYEVSVNEIIFNRLFELCDLKENLKKQGKVISYKFGDEEIEATILQKKLNCHFENRTIKIPPNLSILASMNTSDSSIYYMDSAFKRRWEWEFIDVDSNTVAEEGVAFPNRVEWIAFVGKLNSFIKSKHKSIRGIEDKQIGHFFITDDVIQNATIQNKLMFFLWDSVFNRDKKPLIDLLFDDDKENELITFGDFAKQVNNFIEKIQERE
ncbi:MAG: leucine-rich repeat domain-containing protein [Methylococcales bacterium]|nr:leucine-rich repeat domain-containing protein [Methylococcales bacterium]